MRPLSENARAEHVADIDRTLTAQRKVLDRLYAVYFADMECCDTCWAPLQGYGGGFCERHVMIENALSSLRLAIDAFERLFPTK